MVSHDRASCRQLESEILNIVKESGRALSLEQIYLEVSHRRNPHNLSKFFYEVFHHTYQLVGRRDLTATVDSNPETILFHA